MAHLFKRGKRYHLKYSVGGKQKEIALRTDSLQLAKEKKRQFESALAVGNENPFPTQTPIADVLTAYVAAIRARKSAKSAQTDIYYLREIFGPICEAITITSRRTTGKKRPPKICQADKRKRMPVIEATCFEAITPTQIATLIDFKVRDQGLKPKTANHYRSILRRLFNWAIEEKGLRIPNCDGGRHGNNPVARIRPFKEQAPVIRYLSIEVVPKSRTVG